MPPPLVKWWFRYEGGVIEVMAATKSEARSLIKKQLGLKRLPLGAKVRRVTESKE